MECKLCGEEADELVEVSVKGKKKKACEDCAAKISEEGEIAEAALGAVRGMMEYKGKF
jgi:ribosome-binding protein aMBF1 (putative translation factor)